MLQLSNSHKFTHCSDSLVFGSIPKEYYTTSLLVLKYFTITFSYTCNIKLYLNFNHITSIHKNIIVILISECSDSIFISIIKHLHTG